VSDFAPGLGHHGIPCMLMRGGTSKGAYFLADDLPVDTTARDELLLRIMGSPDPGQIDGLGGAHPLTSKVAIVARSQDPDADVAYTFLQVLIDQPVVGAAQTCGNLLAGVGPFAAERGLVPTLDGTTSVRIALVNTGDIATAVFSTPAGRLDYDGDASIDGVPGTAASVELKVEHGADRRLLPTGNVVDQIAGFTVTLIDNGMPVVLLAASDLGVTGYETPAELEQRSDVLERVDRVRLAAAPFLGLGDVVDQTVPKMILLAPPRTGGAVSTRAFIPARVHPSIGVLMAASVAAAVRVPGTIAAAVSAAPPDAESTLIEHPGGTLDSRVRVARHPDGEWRAASVSTRTARKIFDGRVFPRPRL
jgi:4-oxalomesaconate tautomerase